MQTVAAELLGMTTDEGIKDVVRMASHDLAAAMAWLGQENPVADAAAMGLAHLTVDLAARRLRLAQRALHRGGILAD